MSSPANVRRQPTSQPVADNGEWGARIAICSGSRFEPYAAYSATDISSGPGDNKAAR
jgi:hypothetical protein